MSLSFEQSVVCPVLIGRTPLLSSFERVCEQARSGQGQTLLVSGEAGIGKSRLLAEVQSRIGQEQMHFLRA
jgi:predicted ATPase